MPSNVQIGSDHNVPFVLGMPMTLSCFSILSPGSDLGCRGIGPRGTPPVPPLTHRCPPKSICQGP